MHEYNTMRVCRRVCLPQDHERCWTLAAYRRTGGYQTLEKNLREQLDPAAIIDILKTSNLRGRGDAGAPMMQIGRDYYENLSPEKIDTILQTLP